MTQDELDALVAQHGGLLGQPVAVSTELDPATGVKGSNPVYRYTFKDGTHFDMSAHLDGQGNFNGTYDVVNAGTALKASAPKAAAPKTVKGDNGVIYSVNPDGTLTPQTRPTTTAQGQAALQNADTAAQKAKDQAAIDQQKADAASQNADTTDLYRQGQLQQQRIQALLDAGTITNDDATAMMANWWKIHVEQPVAQFQTDQQAQNQYFTQTNEALKTAETFGQDAAQHQIDLLPHEVNPQFGPDYANALNNLANHQPIHFNPQDFTYQLPNLQQVSQDAVNRALTKLMPTIVRGQMGPYNPDAVPGPTAAQVQQAQTNAQAAAGQVVGAANQMAANSTSSTGSAIHPYTPPATTPAGPGSYVPPTAISPYQPYGVVGRNAAIQAGQ